MSHNISALIGSSEALASLSSKFGSPGPTELATKHQVLPLGEERLDALATKNARPIEGFTYLTSVVAKEIARTLDGEPALYIETEYFGGGGCQAAAFFENNEIKWRGAHSDFDGVEQRQSLFSMFRKPSPSSSPLKSPISKGLSMLGVVSGPDKDEFDTLGLGRFRSMKSFGIKSSD